MKFNDTSIDDSDDLIRAVNRAKPNNEVKVDIIRKGEKKTLMATLGKSPRMKNFSFKFGDQFPHGLSIPPGDPFHFGFFPSEELYGLKLEKLTKQLGEFFEVPGDKGLLVTQVRKGSDGEKAGFKAGDVITKVGEKTIHNLDDVREELFDGKNGDVNVGIIRKGKALTLTMSVKGDDDDEEEDDDYSMISPVSPDPLCIETKASHSTCEHTEGSTYAIAPIEYLQTKLLEGVQSLMRLLKEKLLES
ncbi:MAG: PDZ domain-containing protein [Ignavibacteriales bacterium]|nr:PDZ domain-containing protein [Ignavibacteriales bacterium]